METSPQLIWNGANLGSFSPGSKVDKVLGEGFHTNLPEDSSFGKEADFSLDLILRGSKSLSFTPVGESSRIEIFGEWDAPSFKDSTLPGEKTNMPEGWFKAIWSVSHLNRSYPQVGSPSEYLSHDERFVLRDFVASVDVFEPITLYTQVMRSIKYALLFIGLTFTTLFTFEVAKKERLHVLQYGLVGVSMLVFYLALLSLAEHTRFLNAFVVAAGITVMMNSLYMAAAMRSIKQGCVVGGILAALYGVLYTLLGLESFALLVGTGVILLVVAILMYLTRHLGSSNASKQGQNFYHCIF